MEYEYDTLNEHRWEHPADLNRMHTLADLESTPMTKGELADKTVPVPYDVALPQQWLDDLAANAIMLDYNQLSSTLVWAYPESARAFGLPAPLCEETAWELRRRGFEYYRVGR